MWVRMRMKFLPYFWYVHCLHSLVSISLKLDDEKYAYMLISATDCINEITSEVHKTLVLQYFLWHSKILFQRSMQNYIYCRTTLEMAASSDSEDESFVELGRPLPFIEGYFRLLIACCHCSFTVFSDCVCYSQLENFKCFHTLNTGSVSGGCRLQLQLVQPAASYCAVTTFTLSYVCHTSMSCMFMHKHILTHEHI